MPVPPRDRDEALQDQMRQYEPSLDMKLSQRHGSTQDIRMHTLTELKGIPKPTSLVTGILDLGTLAVLYGGPGVGKTFAALDLALHVALGRAWLGREVQYGSVIYVAAEGYRSLYRRAETWLQYYNIPDPPDNFKIVIDPVNLMGGVNTQRIFIEQAISTAEEMTVRREIQIDGEGNPYAEIVEEHSPPPVKLIVFDTLARCITGAEENDAKDMGQMIQWVDAIREQSIVASTPTVILVHHTGKATQAERGSTVVRGAADTMLHLVSDGSGPVLKCTKQKDDEPFPDQRFLIHRTDGGEALIIPRGAKKPQAPIELTGSFEEIEESLSAKQLETMQFLTLMPTIVDSGVTMKEIVDPLMPKQEVTYALIYQNMHKLKDKGLVFCDESVKPMIWTILAPGWAFVDFLKKQKLAAKQAEFEKLINEAPEQKQL